MGSKNAILPDFLRPHGDIELTRIGRANDGGYLVDPRTIEATDVLIGFGVNDDWSFEEDFIARRPIPVFAYDPTVNRKLFMRRLQKAFMRPHRLKDLSYAYRVLTGYDNFFRDDRVHIEKFVGMPHNNDAYGVSDILAQYVPNEKKVFFKIDIEGSEYRIFDDLIAYANRISGLVIEFHDVDLHMSKIERFVGEFSLKICHVHGNNYGGIMPDGTPPVIECSFTSQELSGPWSGSLPHELDAPCRANKTDYTISFG